MVDGSRLLRVLPMSDECRRYSERYVFELGYQGNNVLCVDWDARELEKLDYNGVYENLYQMQYGEALNFDEYPKGIPMEDFEKLVMSYFPITEEEIRTYAVLDEENMTYPCISLGCSNYSPSLFGTSIPEVTNVRENGDGTITLTVNAVCEMILCDEAFITHELTIREEKGGQFQYMGNRILDNGTDKVPEYQFRVK